MSEEEKPQEPWKPRVIEPEPSMWDPGQFKLFTERSRAWLGEVELTQEIKEPLVRARTPMQAGGEIMPDWQSLTSGDWAAIRHLKRQLYERRGE